MTVAKPPRAGPFRVELLTGDHERTSFSSGSIALDTYFRQQVGQDVRRRVTSCFVAVSPAKQVAGFYTLAASSVVLSDLPAAAVRKLPRYPSVHVVRMGRLAVHMDFKGQGLGGALLADALSRACASDIAAYALVVDAKDSSALDFYLHHGFTAFASMPRSLFLPLTTVAAIRN